MSICIFTRLAYKHGIPKPENKVYEVSGLCNCGRCRNLLIPRKRRNRVVAYVKDESDIDKAIKFVSHWTCPNEYEDLPNQYYYLLDNGTFQGSRETQTVSCSEVNYLDSSIVSIEIDTDGHKVAHIMGDSYHADDASDTPYRFTEYCWGYIPIEDLIKNGLPDGDWYAELKQYVEDCSLERIDEIYEHYDNGKKPKFIALKDITEDTPCGVYIIIE